MADIFGYMFKDNKFLDKALSYFGLYAIGTFAIYHGGALLEQKDIWCISFILIGMFTLFITQGYVFSCIKALIEQNENYVLPYLSWKKNLICGLKYFLAIILFALCVAAVSLPVSFLIAMLGVLLKSKILANVLFAIFIILVALTVMYFSIALTRIFTETEKITSFLQFKKAQEIIKTNTNRYLNYTGILVCTSIAAFVIAFLLGLGAGLIIPDTTIAKNIASSVIGAFVGTYLMFVCAYITAKAVQ